MTRKVYEEFLHSYNYGQMSGGSFIIVATQYINQLEQRIAELQCAKDLSYIRIKELEAPKTCGNCKFIEKQGDTYFVCTNTEFETRTTIDTECFTGYKPKETT